MLSVLLATHNGSDTIERTLEAMTRLDTPPGGWKLVVVNNASTDDTEARIAKWRDRLPLEYVLEPRLGKPFALNTGLSRAEGDLFIMTDDDVLPVAGWLTELRRVADEHPQCSIFGGGIVPHFDGGPPSVPMRPYYYGILYGATSIRVEGETESMTPAGANMTLRSSVYEQGWRFDETFMRGALGLMGEDTDLALRLRKSGHKIGFAPTAEVGHIIQDYQKSLNWMRKRFYRFGRAEFMHDCIPDPERISFEFPRWRVRRAVGSLAGLCAATVTANRGDMVERLLALALDLGALSQAGSLLPRRVKPA